LADLFELTAECSSSLHLQCWICGRQSVTQNRLLSGYCGL